MQQGQRGVHQPLPFFRDTRCQPKSPLEGRAARMKIPKSCRDAPCSTLARSFLACALPCVVVGAGYIRGTIV